MKVSVAFLVFSFVVLLAQPSEGFFGLIGHAIHGIASLIHGADTKKQADQNQVDQKLDQMQLDQKLDQMQLDQKLDQMQLDQQQLDQQQEEELEKRSLKHRAARHRFN